MAKNRNKNQNKKNGVGSFFKRMMNPLTHRKDLDDTYERYEELRSGFVKKQENLEKQIVRMQKDSENLYEVRKQSVKVIQKVVAEIKKIQNCPAPPDISRATRRQLALWVQLELLRVLRQQLWDQQH